jgi:hypothetical protein
MNDICASVFKPLHVAQCTRAVGATVSYVTARRKARNGRWVVCNICNVRLEVGVPATVTGENWPTPTKDHAYSRCGSSEYNEFNRAEDIAEARALLEVYGFGQRDIDLTLEAFAKAIDVCLAEKAKGVAHV